MSDSGGARPNSPALHPDLAEELLSSLTRWTVDASVPLAHRLMELGDEGALASYDAMALGHPDTAGLLEDRYLSPTPEIEELAVMDEGSLGRAFADYITTNNLNVAQLRESAFIEAHARRGDDIGHLAERGFQLHDMFHVLTGYDTSPLGEVRVVSFTVAQFPAPYPAMVMTSRPLQMALYEPALLPFVMDAVAEGWILGRAADPLISVRWEDHWEKPLADLRASHGLD